MPLSPMMIHYSQIKEKHPDCIVFYRLGDFYEMFFEDAILASKVLDITLTGRDCGLDERAPMCGIPYHAVDGYIKKLVEQNYKVAICEQLSEPKPGSIVERDVIKIITPGTIFGEDMLENNKNNFIASIYKKDGNIGVCYCDITTGEFKINEFTSLQLLNDFLVRVQPSEVICNEEMYTISKQLPVIKQKLINDFETYYEWTFDYAKSLSKMNKQFSNNCLSIFEIKGLSNAICASGALLEYLNETQKRNLLHINRVQKEQTNDFMILDSNTRRNLELTETIRDRKRKGSLLWLLDNTKTNMGARKLRNWLEQPLINSGEINNRLNSVEELIKNLISRENIAENLSKIRDIERLAGKTAYGNLTPKDCVDIKCSLMQISLLKSIISNFSSKKIIKIQEELFDYTDLVSLLDIAIDEKTASTTIKDGGYIKKGYNVELDQFNDAKENGTRWMTDLENREKELTGIKNLKIKYNKVFGYFIEITNSALSNVPMRYIRKQTLVNNERFITDELKKIEDNILNATDESTKLEQKLFEQIRNVILQNLKNIQITANAIAELDCLLSFAQIAVKNNYVKPLINNKISHIKIIDGRHPVVETSVKNETFIPNDTFLNGEADNIMIITGPNMAGKSTYMRQVAVITLLAHIGCFVPARSAEISITDRIFTRVGASDDLAFGQSTFMVEMSEVAQILLNATNNSLVILDEIGRGTSTFDGLSIAWSVVEYISKNLKCKTLFATHYHELTELEGFVDGVKNYKISVKEFNDSILFLRKIIRGGANKSFGIEVAKMAGVPNSVIETAKKISAELEQNDINKNNALQSQMTNQDNIDKTRKYMAVISLLKDVNIDTLSPLSAFEIVCDAIKKLNQ